MSVFSFKTHEAFIEQILKDHSDDRGYRTKMAHAINVHPSYITRIFNGSTDASMRDLADKKLYDLKQQFDELGNSLQAEKMNPADENEYYTNWIYSALHILGTLQID